MSLDSSNVQREKMIFELVEPYIQGFSVEPTEIDTTISQSPSGTTNVKRKANATTPKKDHSPEIIDLITPQKDKSKKTKKSKK